MYFISQIVFAKRSKYLTTDFTLTHSQNIRWGTRPSYPFGIETQIRVKRKIIELISFHSVETIWKVIVAEMSQTLLLKLKLLQFKIPIPINQRNSVKNRSTH